MYLALFLTPWILIYALSTAAMNHREFLREQYGGEPAAWEKLSETTYTGAFPDGASPEVIAGQLLAGLDKRGYHQVRYSEDDGTYTINRHFAVNPERIVYDPASAKLTIERQVFRAPVFLERMHRRRGYQTGFPVENAWAFSVDLVIAAMVFWVISGLWMWWGIRPTRKWGAICAASGIVIFALFLATI
jgi:hypothetical protein